MLQFLQSLEHLSPLNISLIPKTHAGLRFVALAQNLHLYPRCFQVHPGAVLCGRAKEPSNGDREKSMNITSRAAASMGAITLLLLAGCAASTPRPDSQLASAETSIELAEESGAREYGPTALERARTKLSLAQQAADRDENETALRLASEAELDAELAASQADRYKAEEALAEINQSIQTLREEIARNALNTGGQS